MNNKELIEKFEKIVVQIQTEMATGSGFYLKKYHLVITNYHVINGSNDVILIRSSNERHKADIIYLDPSMDVAFLRPELNFEDADDVELVSPMDLENGSAVIAIGHPHGLKFTATQGIVSKVSRFFSGLRYVQTDAAINPGNSGGPLVNEEGKIIGINTFIISQSNNLGFALHIDHIFDHLEMIKNIKESIFLCPSCSNELRIVGKFCPFCGQELPDNLPVQIEIDHLPPEKIFEEILQEMNVNPINARRGNNLWLFDYGSAKVMFMINQDGTIMGESYLAKIPKQHIVEAYEYLLRENPKLGTELRFGTNDKHIVLNFTMNAVSLDSEHYKDTVRKLLINADSYDDILFNQFDCEEPDIDDMEL